MATIEVKSLSRVFTVSKKEPGLSGSIKALFKPNLITKKALDDVSLTINEGEIVGLIGANGAGKTTLVKILSGIIYPTSGEATVLGHVPWKRSHDMRSQISLIMGQKAQLWWDLPAEDCLLLLREIYQVPKEEFEKRKSRLVQVLGLEKLMNVQIRRLSLGERMKMELMAALLHNPKVVFLDEPTIGLDLTAQRAIRQFIRDYQQENRPAMILTSHYMEDIAQLCHRIIILREGRIVYDGPLATVVEQFSTHKLIKIKFLPETEVVAKIKSTQVEVLDIKEDQASLKIRREDVAKVSARLMSELKILDLNIEEPDISDVIEKMMRKK